MSLIIKKKYYWDFPGGPVVGNLPGNEEDMVWANSIKCHRPANIEHHNYWSLPVLCIKRSHHNEKLEYYNRAGQQLLLTAARESPRSNEDQLAKNKNKFINLKNTIKVPINLLDDWSNQWQGEEKNENT